MENKVNQELYQFYKPANVINNTVARLIWAGNVEPMDECELAIRTIKFKPYGLRSRGRQKLR